MDDRKISLLLPSAYRAAQLKRALDMIYESVSGPIEVCVSVVSDDYASQQMTREYRLITLDVRSHGEYELGAVYAWNKLAMRATGDVLVLWADDVIPQNGWLENALAELDCMGGDGLIGFNDLSGDPFAAHWLATRHFIVEHLGGVIYPPAYYGWWCDREMSERAQRIGRFAIAQGAIIEHATHLLGKSKTDRTYADALPYHNKDRALYESRKAAGYPIDYQAVIREFSHAGTD